MRDHLEDRGSKPSLHELLCLQQLLFGTLKNNGKANDISACSKAGDSIGKRLSHLYTVDGNLSAKDLKPAVPYEGLKSTSFGYCRSPTTSFRSCECCSACAMPGSKVTISKVSHAEKLEDSAGG